MGKFFDVFEIGTGGDLRWRYSAESPAQAHACIETFAKFAAGEYMIVDHNTGKRVVVSASGSSANTAMGAA